MICCYYISKPQQITLLFKSLKLIHEKDSRFSITDCTGMLRQNSLMCTEVPFELQFIAEIHGTTGRRYDNHEVAKQDTFPFPYIGLVVSFPGRACIS